MHVSISGGPGYYRADVFRGDEYLDGAAADTWAALSQWLTINYPGVPLKD